MADGDRTLKDCLKEVKSTNDVKPHEEGEVTWATIATAIKEAKLDFGKKIQPQTWKTNWAPILDEAVRVERLLKRAEFKRRQVAPLLKVSPQAFGSGWQLPSEAI